MNAAAGAAPALPAIDNPDFHASVSIADSALDMRLAGTADLNVRKQLDAFLASVHALASQRAVTRVTVDMRALEFMNSSCLKGVVSWIGTVHEAPPDRQYRIVFLAKTGSRWQRRSLFALSAVATNLVSIQD
jgi:hypothetical protein